MFQTLILCVSLVAVGGAEGGNHEPTILGTVVCILGCLCSAPPLHLSSVHKEAEGKAFIFVFFRVTKAVGEWLEYPCPAQKGCFCP